SDCLTRVRRALEQDPTSIDWYLNDKFGLELPIVKAARAGRSQAVIEALLEAGAAADLPPGSPGMSPLAALAMGLPTACAMEQNEQASLFEPFAAVLPPWGQSPPNWELPEHICCQKPDDERTRIAVARCLLKAGANPERRDADGLTASDLAASAGRHRLARLLRRSDGIRCRELLEAMWAKHSATGNPTLAHHDLLDLPDIPQACLSSFLSLKKQDANLTAPWFFL
ncbi:unnamed protein product, partial [Polarella glacialis]